MLEILLIGLMGFTVIAVGFAIMIGLMVATIEFVTMLWERYVPDPPRLTLQKWIEYGFYALVAFVLAGMVVWASLLVGTGITDGMGWTDYNLAEKKA